MEESTFSYALRDFINIIITNFLAEKIAFLNTEVEVNEITSGFRTIGRILHRSKYNKSVINRSYN
jgi:type III secretory pathway component EscU